MKRIYGSDHTQLTLTGKALEAYNNIGDIKIVEYTDRAYKIKPEFIHLWGEGVNADTIIWDCDLGYYASEWETTESDLLDQLEEFPMYGVFGQIETYNMMTADQLIKWLEDGML